MRKDFGERVDYGSNWETFVTFIPLLAVVFGGMGLLIGGLWVIGEVIDPQADRDQRYDLRVSKQNEIIQVIDNGKLTCEYVGDLRMEYAGISGFTPIEDNYIEKKLMTYWNVNSCGVEWNWYND